MALSTSRALNDAAYAVIGGDLVGAITSTGSMQINPCCEISTNSVQSLRISKMKYLLITIGYSDHLAIPSRFIDHLDDFKIVKGDTYTPNGMSFDSKRPSIRVVDADTIKQAEPDPAVVTKMLKERLAKLEEEKASLEKELVSL